MYNVDNYNKRGIDFIFKEGNVIISQRKQTNTLKN